MEAMPRAGAMPDLGEIFAMERGRLVGLCAHLTGSADAAEDLAQETLAEAWRIRHRLHDPNGTARWLSAIARNVCARWARSRSRDRARLTASPDRDEQEPLADAFDLAVELERDELAHLLDRALAYLPTETSGALVARYVEGSPQAQVAMRLGLSEGAVAMRLQRGKMALRRLLATELRDEAAAYGLSSGEDDRWEDARIWCPLCGRQRLQARLVHATGELTVRCPGCTPENGTHISHAVMPLLHRETTSARAGVTRLLEWMHGAYYGLAPTGRVRCQRCERPTPPVVTDGAWSHGAQLRYTVATTCAACGHRDRMWLSGVALALPVGRRFWREHGRVRLLTERPVEVDGQPAAVIGFASVTSGARLEIVAQIPTLAVVAIHGGSESVPPSWIRP